MNRKLLQILGFVLACLVVVEASSFFVVEFWMRPHGEFYDPASLEGVLSESVFEDYLAERHPLTGWPAPGKTHGRSGEQIWDRSGARPSPSYPEPRNACVSVYGASFAYAGEVGHADAWTDRLARKLGCRVANYGVPAYGTDQALLRFLDAESDEAPTAILAFMSSNIERNLNQWALYKYSPPLYSEWRQFKPRFVVRESGELELLPLPTDSWEDVRRGVLEPARWLENDYWAPGSASGLPVLSPSFPYAAAVYRVLRSELSGNPRRDEGHLAFFSPDHPSKAYQLTRAILLEFAEKARERGQQPVILFIPSSKEFQSYRETGEWVSGPLAAEVAAAGIPTANVLEEIASKVGVEQVCDYYTSGGCRYHFDPAGNELFAEVVLDQIDGLVDRFDHARSEIAGYPAATSSQP